MIYTYTNHGIHAFLAFVEGYLLGCGLRPERVESDSYTKATPYGYTAYLIPHRAEDFNDLYEVALTLNLHAEKLLPEMFGNLVRVMPVSWSKKTHHGTTEA